MVIINENAQNKTHFTEGTNVALGDIIGFAGFKEWTARNNGKGFFCNNHDIRRSEGSSGMILQVNAVEVALVANGNQVVTLNKGMISKITIIGLNVGILMKDGTYFEFIR